MLKLDVAQPKGDGFVARSESEEDMESLGDVFVDEAAQARIAADLQARKNIDQSQFRHLFDMEALEEEERQSSPPAKDSPKPEVGAANESTTSSFTSTSARGFAPATARSGGTG